MSCFWTVVTMLILSCVNRMLAEDVAVVKEGPVSMDHLRFLSAGVCYELFPLEFEERAKCVDKFTNSTSDIAPDPAQLQFKCRSKTKAIFSAEPTKIPQLVILVPDDDLGGIGSKILKSSAQTGTIRYITDSYNYRFWSSDLFSDGSHSIWRRGPDLPPWNENGTTGLKVTIEEPIFKYVAEKKQFSATFRINIIGKMDECSSFEAVNICNKQEYMMLDKKITPNLTSEIQDRTTIELTTPYLPMHDKCTLEIYAADNVLLSKLKYHTPIPEYTHLPERVTNVTLEAVATVAGWDVTVCWARPKRDPLRYILTLRTPDEIGSVNITGQETWYTFTDVKSEEGALYNVTIQSVTLNGTAQTVQRGLFPARPSYQAVIITGSWSVVLTVAAAVIGVLIWWQRRRANNNLSLLPPEMKLPKECLMESCPESGVEDHWELRSERLLLHEVIGEGAFGVVRKGTLAPGGKEVAVKMLKDFPTLDEIRSFRAEMELMKSVGVHPHIVSLVGCCSGRRPLIVAEYCNKGDLLSFLRRSWDVMVSKRNAKYYNNNIEASDYRNDLFKKQKDPNFPPLVINKLYDMQGLCDAELTPLDLLSFCRQIAMGMEFLASNRVVHRDLAARNILVTGDRTLKIADFGLSRDVYQENQYKQKGNGKLPVKWMALESLTHRIYTTQSDVWSFGVVIWEVVTVGGAPYPDVAAARLPRLLKAGYRMPKPNNCSKQLYDLMTSCWRARPRERPTFAELHRQLDELLNGACADEYLSLELDYEPPPTPRPQRYIRMLLRANRVWARGENYERPLKAPQSNHYSTPPHSNAKNSWHSPVLTEPN